MFNRQQDDREQPVDQARSALSGSAAGWTGNACSAAFARSHLGASVRSANPKRKPNNSQQAGCA